MKKMLLAVIVLISTNSVFADTMKCVGLVYKGEDFLNSQTTEDAFLKKAAKEFNIAISGNDAESATDAVVNGVPVTFILTALGQSKAYQAEFYYITGVPGQPTVEAKASDVLYFQRTEDGKPGTKQGEWPFPGKNSGDVYTYNTFRGGSLGLSQKVVDALRKANLFQKNHYQFNMSLLEIHQLREDVVKLKGKGLIQDSDVVALATYGDCYLKK